jgi:hypothetical protein
MRRPNPPTFEITFRAEAGDSIPAITRVRAMLKQALRIHGLRCTKITETTTQARAQETEADDLPF